MKYSFILFLLISLCAYADEVISLPEGYRITQGSVESNNLQKLFCNEDFDTEMSITWLQDQTFQKTYLGIFDPIFNRYYAIDLATWDGTHDFSYVLPFGAYYSDEVGFRADLVLIPAGLRQQKKNDTLFKGYRDGLRFIEVKVNKMSPLLEIEKCESKI